MRVLGTQELLNNGLDLVSAQIHGRRNMHKKRTEKWLIFPPNDVSHERDEQWLDNLEGAALRIDSHAIDGNVMIKQVVRHAEVYVQFRIEEPTAEELLEIAAALEVTKASADSKEIKTSGALGRQVGGTHYKNNAIQPIEFVMANGLGFCEANVVKYVTRYQSKGGTEDLRKVEHYLQLHMETIQSEPWLLRQIRIWLANKGELGIQCYDYFAANDITDPRQQILITGVCYWRGDGNTYSLETMLNAVRALISDEMIHPS